MGLKKVKFSKSYKYPCIERIKQGYIYLAISVIPLLITYKTISLHRDDPLKVIKITSIMVLVYVSTCLVIYFTLLYFDLLFLKKFSKILSEKICSVSNAWEMLYKRRGIRLNDYLLNKPEVALLIIKLMYNYSETYQNDEIKKNADIMYNTLKGISKAEFDIDIASMSLAEVAETTQRYLTSGKSISLKIFHLTSMPLMQAIFVLLFIVIFAAFMIMQFIKFILTL